MTFGPDRQSDAYPLTDAGSAYEVRRALGTDGRGNYRFATAPEADLDWLSARETELGAARDRLIWGDDPFDLEDW